MHVPFSDAHPLGALYARSTLDCLVELAVAVADDHRKSPKRLSALREGTGEILDAMCERLGRDEDWPDLVERTRAYGAFVDPFLTKEIRNVCSSELALRGAAKSCVASDAGARSAVLRQSFIDAAYAFRLHLHSLQELPGSQGAQAAQRLFWDALTVLRDPTVARAFGVEPPRDPRWPEQDDVSGTALVVAISSELDPPTAKYVTAQDFDIVQRLARVRAATISALMRLPQDARSAGDHVDPLIELAYRWEQVVGQCCISRAIRAGRELNYADFIAGQDPKRIKAIPPNGILLGVGGPASLEHALRAATCE